MKQLRDYQLDYTNRYVLGKISDEVTGESDLTRLIPLFFSLTMAKISLGYMAQGLDEAFGTKKKKCNSKMKVRT